LLLRREWNKTKGAYQESPQKGIADRGEHGLVTRAERVIVSWRQMAEAMLVDLKVVDRDVANAPAAPSERRFQSILCLSMGPQQPKIV